MLVEYRLERIRWSSQGTQVAGGGTAMDTDDVAVRAPSPEGDGNAMAGLHGSAKLLGYQIREGRTHGDRDGHVGEMMNRTGHRSAGSSIARPRSTVHARYEPARDSAPRFSTDPPSALQRNRCNHSLYRKSKRPIRSDIRLITVYPNDAPKVTIRNRVPTRATLPAVFVCSTEKKK